MAEDRTPTRTPEGWDQRYQQGDTPWDTGTVSAELARVLDAGEVPAGRAIELGCGSGTNSVYLARRGFEVFGFDLSSVAIESARQRAKQENVKVEFQAADVCDLAWPQPPVDFLFDRGCYHCVRRVDLPGYLRTVAAVVRPGGKFLLLAGNANEPRDPGPPTVSEAELRGEFAADFTVDRLREFRFDAVDMQPLGWSCLMTRRR